MANKTVTTTFNSSLVEQDFLAVLDNLMIFSTIDSTLGNTVFEFNEISVGCNFLISTFSDAVCGWSALWFNVGPTISGKTILEAKLILTPSILPADLNDTYKV